MKNKDRFSWESWKDVPKDIQRLVGETFSELERSGKRRLRYTFLITMSIFGLLALLFKNFILLIIGIIVFIFIIGYFLSRP